MPSIDLLIKNAVVVTLDGDRRVLDPGAVGVEDGRIVAVGEERELLGMQAGRVLDVSRKILLPGFVNSHSHSLANLMRGGPSDTPIDARDWLHNSLDPAMRAYTRRDAHIAARLYCLEAIRAGITTTVENADYSMIPFMFEEAMRAYQEMGIRVVYGEVFCDLVPPDWDALMEVWKVRYPEVSHHWPPIPLQQTDVALKRIEERIRSVNSSSDSRIQVCPAPIVSMRNSREGLLGARDIAKRYRTPLLIHAAVYPSDRIHGMGDVQYLDAIDFLGPNVLAAHMIDVDSNDIRILKKHAVKVAHCPASNMFCGLGTAPIVEYINAGITVGLGADDPNINQNLTLVQDMKIAALAQAQKYGSNSITPEQILEIATLGGARAVGLDNEIGSIESGKKADLILMDLAHPHTTPWHNVASALVFQACGTEVDTVIVDGHVLMENGCLTLLTAGEEAEFLLTAQEASVAVLERAGMRSLRDRGWRSTA